MTKTEVLDLINREWRQLLFTAKGFEPESQTVAGAVGHWTLAQCLVHVAGWDQEVINLVRTFIESGTKNDPPHNINEIIFEGKENMDVEATWEYLHSVHETFISYLESLPESIFDPESYTGNWLGETVPQHYIGHRQDIEAFSEILLTRFRDHWRPYR